ncbi:MAG: URC4/urg3 family protein, partial [Kiloniellales bacterium]
ALVPERLAPTADYVLDTIRAAYPSLQIPYHARWRHFAVGGRDRWAELVERAGLHDRAEAARVGFDLVVTSVLLDAGAGERWRYREPASGQSFARSEGLAVASFDLFAAGGFSSDPKRPLRADAAALRGLPEGTLTAGFQVTADNPLVGLQGRLDLMRRLGEALEAEPDLFGADAPRPGGLYDYLAGQAAGGALPAKAILAAVLRGFAPIWPGRLNLDDANLGDVWRHPAIRTDDLTDGLVPFHKLSQWLTYSLVEPLEAANIGVTGLDALTGLPEYRNGGLLIDCGLLRPKHPAVLGETHRPEDVVIVEWRALTVALLDRLAELIRARLGLDQVALPLAKVLEGGTWSAGRRIAAERRPGGPPPIRLESDGTVF